MISDFNELNLLFAADKWLEENFGCEFYSTRSGWLNSSCPFTDHPDSNPSFGINLETGIFNCFGCSREGDFFKLIMLLLGVTFHQSVNIISQSCGLDVTNFDSFKYKNEKFQKALLEEDYEENKNKQLIQRATIKIKKIMNHDFDQAEQMYKSLDQFIEIKDYKKIKEMVNGTIG